MKQNEVVNDHCIPQNEVVNDHCLPHFDGKFQTVVQNDHCSPHFDSECCKLKIRYVMDFLKFFKSKGRYDYGFYHGYPLALNKSLLV